MVANSARIAQLRGRHSLAGRASRLLLLLSAAISGTAAAQDLEPRAYANTPTGMKFFVAGYGHNEGSLIFDPALPIEGAHAKADVGVLGFAHAFSIAGKSAKWAIAAPFADLEATGNVAGTFHQRNVTGFADPTLAITINLFGAPALALPEFRAYRQDTIIGTTLKVTAPVGQYDNDRLINIGTHRWSVKPELGISKALGRFIIEGAASLSWQETNDDFLNGRTLQQDLVYSAQGHLIYSHQSGWWAAVNATYYMGGQTTIDGVRSNSELDNWRVGVTMTTPLSTRNSVKLAASRGVSARTGTDFDSILLAWQLRWGGGL